MRGDFSRLTFRPENHYSGVRLQQGRVQLDCRVQRARRHRGVPRPRDGAGRGRPRRGAAGRRRLPRRGSPRCCAGWRRRRRARGRSARTERCCARPMARDWTLEPRPNDSGRLNAVSFEDEASGWAVGDASGDPPARERGDRQRRDPAGRCHGRPPRRARRERHDARGRWGPAGPSSAGTARRLAAPGAETPDVTAALRDVHFDCRRLRRRRRRHDHRHHRRRSELGGRGLPTRTPATCTASSSARPDTRWAVGEQGTILFFDGTEWTRQAATPRAHGHAARRGRSRAPPRARPWATAGPSSPPPTAARPGRARSCRASPPTCTTSSPRPGGILIAVGDDVSLMRSAGGAWTTTPDLPADSNGVRVGRTLAVSAGDMYVGGIRCENERTASLARAARAAARRHLPRSRLGRDVRRLPPGAGAAPDRGRARGAPGGGARRPGHGDAHAHRVAGGPGPDRRGQRRPARTSRRQCGRTRRVGGCGRVRSRRRSAPATASCRRAAATSGLRTSSTGWRSTHRRPAAAMSYKWSRDNGSVVARLLGHRDRGGNGWRAGDGRRPGCPHVGRDATLGFGPEQLVEITDEGRMLRGEPGVMAEVGEVDGNTLLLDNVEQAGADDGRLRGPPARPPLGRARRCAAASTGARARVRRLRRVRGRPRSRRQLPDRRLLDDPRAHADRRRRVAERGRRGVVRRAARTARPPHAARARHDRRRTAGGRTCATAASCSRR